MLITFEGIDGSGKSTQIQLLTERLKQKGKEVKPFREPGGTPLSEKVRSLLLDAELSIDPVSELLLFSAARAQLIAEKIEPLLDKQVIVILDRFYDSTTAYQGYGRNSLPLQDIHRLNKMASHQYIPDITFYLQVTQQQAQQRTHFDAKDRMERSGKDFYKKVINGFEALAKQEERFRVIDASGTARQTHQIIWDLLKERFPAL